MITTRSLIAEFAADVRRDLALEPKQLQSKYLYDALGSSLFEAICRLPWYPITRAEHRLLVRHAADVVDALRGAADAASPHATIVELGCGSGEKLVVLAEALQKAGGSARVDLIDVSSQALEQTEQRLNGLRHFSVVGHQFTYEEGLRRAAAARDDERPMLVLLLGSNIGNFDAPAALDFVRRIRLALRPGDLLLLGADLVKPEPVLLVAYDDPLGVTAAFNRNLLVRINRELQGTFDLGGFDHVAVWNAREQRIEMHLQSRVAQTVHVGVSQIVVRFARGERIWTESSYKYEPHQIERMGVETGFAMRDQWIDVESPFALSLMTAI
jgi:L-histidine Nalpha-methyltransferase